MKEREADILIVGAGCAGTSLAHHLRRLGYGGTIALLDERLDWAREQRWCSWRVPASLSHLIERRWTRWQVRDGAQIAAQSGAGLAYHQIGAPEFFEFFQRQWRRDERTIFCDGTRVESLDETASGVEARTSRGVFRARLAFDARHAGSSALEKLEAPAHLHLRQSFVGWTIESARPCFDAQTATLMDFRLGATAQNANTQNAVAQSEGVSFAYVLPESPTRALVESTHFGRRALSAGAHQRALERYLREFVVGAADFRITARESGELPMASAPLRSRLSARVWAIGVAGGAARPSSGYAFGRIQKQSAQLARAIVSGSIARARPAPIAAPKYAVLDEIFLDVMAHDPALARRCFMEMFARVPPAALVRFLSEQSTPCDDAQLIAALPKLAFCAASLRRLIAHLEARGAHSPAPELAEA